MTNCELDYNRRVLLNQAGFQKTTQSVIDFVNLSPVIKPLSTRITQNGTIFDSGKTSEFFEKPPLSAAKKHPNFQG